MEEIKKIIYKCILENNYSIKSIILFGSRTREDYKEDSDYDILIVINEKIENEKKIDLSCAITRELAENWINADIIVKSNDDLALYENYLGSVIRTALKEGVII